MSPAASRGRVRQLEEEEKEDAPSSSASGQQQLTLLRDGADGMQRRQGQSEEGGGAKAIKQDAVRDMLSPFRMQRSAVDSEPKQSRWVVKAVWWSRVGTRSALADTSSTRIPVDFEITSRERHTF